jgi:hypothetical protein
MLVGRSISQFEFMRFPSLDIAVYVGVLQRKLQCPCVQDVLLQMPEQSSHNEQPESKGVDPT